MIDTKQKYKLLYVEDDIDDQLEFSQVFGATTKNYEYTIASTLSECEELLAENKFDIILSDFQLPGGNAFDVIELAEGIPTIIVTGAGGEETAIEAINKGAYDYMVKDPQSNYLKLLPLTLDKALIRKSTEDQLNMLSIAVSKSDNSIIIADKTGLIDWVNEGFTRITGYSLEEIKGTYGEVLRRGQGTGLSDVANTIVKDKKPISYEVKNFAKDGKEYWAFSSITPILDQNGEVVQIVAIDSDITERKEIEEERENMTTRLISLIENMTVGVIFEDKYHQIVHMNQLLQQFFHLEFGPKSYLSMNCHKFFKENKRLFAEPGEFIKIIENIASKKTLVQHQELSLADGGTFDFSYVPVKVADRFRGNLWIFRDYTERKRNEQELIKAKQIAEESAKAKEQFLANVSHEIRTPMNAIMGMGHLLKTANHTPKEKNYLDTINQSAANLLVIINDLLDLSKIESGKFSLEETEFHLEDTINNLITALSYKVQEKNIYLNSKLANKLPPVLKGDPVRLTQILTNLVGNAIKFTEKGGVVIEVNLITEEVGSCKIHFAVSDTGIGIPENKLEKIFESFTQASADTTRKFGGSGLGLTISKQLVELQGGDIKVESKVNQGSVFSFDLVYKTGDPKKIVNQDDKLSLIEFSGLKNVRILLVEDNKINQEVVVDLIKVKNENIKIDIAENGKEAIERISDNNYDLVFMDVQMPVMDGYEATKFVREELDKPKKNIPIIAMTAHATASEKQKCFDSGMNSYLSKPIDPNKLYNTIITTVNSGSDNINKSEPETIHQQHETRNQQTELFDLSFFEKFAEGDESIVIKYIDMYTTHIPSEIKSMAKHIENKSWVDVGSCAHKMKPLFNHMSMNELESWAVLLEENAGSNQPNELLITELVNKINQKWDIACIALNKEKQNRLAQLETI
ncbi:response regulator [bacterium AH-315-C07]|nr:response regulator [bacterium AH-315-C07]